MPGDDLLREVRDLKAMVERHERQLRGENGYYSGLITTVREMNERLERVEKHAEESSREREYRHQRDQRRDKIVLVLLPIIVSGSVTAIFGFLANLFQTIPFAP